jgi:hypothetical protein
MERKRVKGVEREGEIESERERERGRDKAELRVTHTHLLDDHSAVDVIDMTSCSYFLSFRLSSLLIFINKWPLILIFFHIDLAHSLSLLRLLKSRVSVVKCYARKSCFDVTASSRKFNCH